MTAGFVYFICPEDGKHTKIGISRDANERLKQLQTGSPTKLKIAAAIPTDNPRKLERELHDEYASHRINGEWFDIPETMAISIARSYGADLHKHDSIDDLMNTAEYFADLLREMADDPDKRQNPTHWYSYEDVDLYSQALRGFFKKAKTAKDFMAYGIGEAFQLQLFLLLQANAWGYPEVNLQERAKELLFLYNAYWIRVSPY